MWEGSLGVQTGGGDAVSQLCVFFFFLLLLSLRESFPESAADTQGQDLDDS